MNCCENCFRDTHIQAIIKQNNVIGTCDFCNAEKIYIIDVSQTPNPIYDDICELIQLYKLSDNKQAKLLKNALCSDWDIFNCHEDSVLNLVKAICATAIDVNSEIFSKPVIIPELFDTDFLKEYSVVRDVTWDVFSDLIKNDNRFHTDKFNADIFASYLSAFAKTYKKGSIFYRARIAKDKIGYKIKEMGTPPKGCRSAGRINPEGIPILYLSGDNKTVLNEIRAAIFDFVTIGKFKLQKDMTVVNLSAISTTSPFEYDVRLEQFAVNRRIFQEIAQEIAKPLRRSDSPLEYLPTQYITEFIKSQKRYEGVEFASTLESVKYFV